MTFEEVFLPHRDAAYNLARWLTRNEDDAQDLVQEAYLRALKFFKGFRGTDGKPWLLTIVRNTFYTWARRNDPVEHPYDFDEALYVCESDQPDPETAQVMNTRKQQVTQAIENLPLEFREVIILREFEELSYKEIAKVTGVPMGTVMSRLARGRNRLQLSLESLNSDHLVTSPTSTPSNNGVVLGVTSTGITETISSI